MMISKAVKVAGEVTYEKGYWLKNLTLVYSDVTKGGGGVYNPKMSHSPEMSHFSPEMS